MEFFPVRETAFPSNTRCHFVYGLLSGVVNNSCYITSNIWTILIIIEFKICISYGLKGKAVKLSSHLHLMPSSKIMQLSRGAGKSLAFLN
jgi:hypothetical protein